VRKQKDVLEAGIEEMKTRFVDHLA